MPQANTFLIWTNGVFDDFELRVEYKILRGNSGVQYRSRVVDSKAWVMAGYQADIDANNADYFSGELFDEGGPRGYLARLSEQVVWGGDDQKRVVGNTGSTAQELRAIIQPGDWNRLLIRAQGDHLVHTLNGRVVVDVTDNWIFT